MHIKQIVVEGFKCYKDRIAADPFSPKHNVVGAPAHGLNSTAHARFPPPSMPPPVGRPEGRGRGRRPALMHAHSWGERRGQVELLRGRQLCPL